MRNNKLSPNAKAFIKKIHIFNLVWGVFSVGVFLLIYVLDIRNSGIIDGIMFGFLFGGEALFHHRQLDKIQSICEEYFPNHPQKAMQAYQSHLAIVRIFAGIGIVGVFCLIVSLISLWLS